MKSLIHVGPDLNTYKTMPTFTKCILEILKSNAGDEVKKEAIRALSNTFQIQNVNISGCNLYGNQKK